MKNIFLMFLIALCIEIICILLSHFLLKDFGITYAQGVSRYGPAPHYKDNGNGTFTDKITGLVWEIKTDDDSIHDVDNTYTWSKSNEDNNERDGTLFKNFLNSLNSTCDGMGKTECKGNVDCAEGEKCGFAGYRDWCIPDVKSLQSIIDYNTFRPASSVYGETATTYYWTATENAFNPKNAWSVNFFDGLVLNSNRKMDSFHARAMRPCS